MTDLMPNMGQTAVVKLPDSLTDKAIDKMLDLIRAEYGVQVNAGIVDGKQMVNELGKVSTRISRNLKKLFGIKLSNAIKTAVGNMAYRFCHTGGTYNLTFGDVLDMVQGVYGDSGSCFYGSNKHHRLAMGDNGRFLAALIHNKEGKPLGRAWVYFCNEDDGEFGETVAIVFNAYGLKLRTITAVVANYLQLPHQAAKLHSDIYINNDLCRAIGHDLWSNYHLDIEIGSNEFCHNCEEMIGEGEASYAFGEAYCEDCYCENFFYCEGCGETYRMDYYAGEGFCDNCAVSCAICGEVINHYYDRVEDEDLCRYCKRGGAFKCGECEDYFMSEFESLVEGVCDTCFCKSYFECQECGTCDKIDENGRSVCACCETCNDCQPGAMCAICHSLLIAGNELLYYGWVTAGCPKSIIVYNQGLPL